MRSTTGTVARDGECASAGGAVIGEMVGEAIVKGSIGDGKFSNFDEWLVKTNGSTAAIFGVSAGGDNIDDASAAA